MKSPASKQAANGTSAEVRKDIYDRMVEFCESHYCNIIIKVYGF